jgi:hypothetical protein
VGIGIKQDLRLQCDPGSPVIIQYLVYYPNSSHVEH